MKRRSLSCRAWFAVVVAAVVLSAGAEERGDHAVVLGLPVARALDHPAIGPAETALGRKIFFDRTLSVDGAVSCAVCHRPELAFTDGRSKAVGADGRVGTRNTQSIANAGYNTTFFWDGRRATLEAQVIDAFFNPNEHGFADATDLLARIRIDPSYGILVRDAFGVPVSELQLAQVATALASFVRSITLANSPVDRYLFGGDAAALSAGELRGLELFRGRAQCNSCHHIGEHDALFTDHQYHSHAVGFDGLIPKLAALTQRLAAASDQERSRLVTTDPAVAALGHFVVTLDPKDIGRFKTPSLRNVALTAPYMHDGSIATLDAAVLNEIYYRGRAMGRPLIVTASEREDIVAFLRALTSFGLVP